MFAVIESGGKQHTVSEGESLKVELLSDEEGSTIEFDKVLMISNGNESKIGNPYVENAKVTAKLVSNGKHDKIRVFKMKRRTGCGAIMIEMNFWRQPMPIDCKKN